MLHFFPRKAEGHPRPIQTKVTILGKNEISNRESLVGLFLHKFFHERRGHPRGRDRPRGGAAPAGAAAGRSRREGGFEISSTDRSDG